MTIAIRTRLTLVYGAVFCLSMAMLETAAYFSVRSGIYLILDRDLQARMAGAQSFLTEHVGRRTLPKLQSELASHAALQPQLLRIEDAAGIEIFRGGAMSGAVPIRTITARWQGAGLEYNLFCASDLTLPEELLRRFRFLIFLSSPAVLAAATAAGYWISKRALRPVSELTLAARSITVANLSQRLAVPDSADELQDLAETLNGMLSRIEDAFRHVSQFTANASHELRAPVALIRVTSEVALLRTNGTEDTYRDALHRVLRESEKSTILLEDMLRLARADSNTCALPLQRVEVNAHIEQACERVAVLAREKEIALGCSLAEPNLLIAANPDHLKRLWLILLDNAIKYTPQGGTVAVRVRKLAEGSVACEVRDSGIGISPADREHIFERFFRADRARSRDEGGTGLGLSIARSIAEAHHARIEVESVLGEGSTFRVVLPVFARTAGHRIEGLAK
jgi:heavy metal sensor kinase